MVFDWRRRHFCFVVQVVLILIGSLAFLTKVAYGQLNEIERVAEYHKRNYTWPPKELLPNTEGWKRNFYRRYEQVARIDDRRERYNGYRESIRASLITQNFTEFGWGLTRAPPDLVAELQQSLRDGLANENKYEEKGASVIVGPNRPWFFEQPQLNKKILETLKPMHEQWSGQKLEGELAYGLRVYRDGAALYMHVDKVLTHVISCILHIDHSDDSEPWPIFIEDYEGNMNEVVLKSGDMLFYESSKCIHGRPRPFVGSWYSSVFVHYYPVGWNEGNPEAESHLAVPPEWVGKMPDEERLKKIEMLGTSMLEPDCPDMWCSTTNAVKWSGPAKDGYVLTAGGKEYKLFPEKNSEEL